MTEDSFNGVERMHIQKDKVQILDKFDEIRNRRICVLHL